MPSLCRDIDDVRFSSEGVRIEKQDGETALAAFVRWISDQADGWCESGLCSSGTCSGHLRNTDATLLEDTGEYIEVSFSTTIYCDCNGGSQTTEDTSGAPGGASAPAPVGGGGGTGGCVCTQAEEDAEFAEMIGYYTNDVTNARDTGYQAGDDAGYWDWGLGLHAVGNCADWQHVSWSALVTRTWRCWKVEQIRAYQRWTAFGFHHFVKLTAECSGRVVYLDPWKTGTALHFEAGDFDFEDPDGWSHTTTHTHGAGDDPRDPGND